MSRPAAAIADEIRLMSPASDLDSWIEQCREASIDRFGRPLNTPDARLAACLHHALIDLRTQVEPVIQMLAEQEADAEALAEREEAA